MVLFIGFQIKCQIQFFLYFVKCLKSQKKKIVQVHCISKKQDNYHLPYVRTSLVLLKIKISLH
jgi:sRNA-binding regulator protein Hfq